MTPEGFTKVGEIRVSLLWMNVAAILISFPVTILFAVAENQLHGFPAEATGWHAVYFLAAFGIQVVLHELLHAIGYVRLGGLHWNQLKFGFNWKAFVPYCNCLSPVALRPFQWTG